ncbi:MAG: hypothetical protein QHH09_02800 [Microgenomates group bacterium]|nr:hypothetical protein [Microgenomates group bacterium]
MKKNILIIGFLIFLLNINVIYAVEEKIIFDSTDNYTGACQLTDKSEWALDKSLNVTKFQMWYKWNEEETTLPITIFKDGKEFASFTATRGDCDIYQKRWCNADYNINKTFPAGAYTTKIPSARQCLKPGSTGTIRLYGTETKENTAPVSSEFYTGGECKELQIKTIIITAIITFIFSYFIFTILNKKKQAKNKTSINSI